MISTFIFAWESRSSFCLGRDLKNVCLAKGKIIREKNNDNSLTMLVKTVSLFQKYYSGD